MQLQCYLPKTTTGTRGVSWTPLLALGLFRLPGIQSLPPPVFRYRSSLTLSWHFGKMEFLSTTDLASGTAYGVWKRSGPPRTYDFKFLWVVPPGPTYPPGTIETGLPYNLVLNPQGTQLTGPFHGFSTGPDGKVIDQISGTVVIDRISFTSNP